MKRQNRFISLKERNLMFACFLLCIFLLFSIIFWWSSGYLREKEDRLWAIQQEYSQLVTGLHSSDSFLYTYAQNRNERLRTSTWELLERLEENARQLRILMDREIFVDLDYLVQSYAESGRAILESDEVGTGDYLSLYQISSHRLELMEALMPAHNQIIWNDQLEQREILEQTRWTVGITVAVGSLALAGLCMVSFIKFSSHITTKLGALTEQAERICDGDWSVTLSSEQGERDEDEIDVLKRAFYRMLEEILRQIEQLKHQEQVELQLKEAELAAVNMKARLERERLRTLQSRVNPHFLFNALNVVAGQAVEEGAEKTTDMIFKTADYLRYSLSRLDKTVTLQEELDNVEDYFAIQKGRFGDRLHYSVQCEAGCERARIPSLILQPLCENALTHGIMPKTEGGSICVSAVSCGGRIKVTVSDDGLGFSPERAAQMEQRLEQEDYDDAEGIGMYNAVHRLRAFFADTDRVECVIESRPDTQTSVSLIFPRSEGFSGSRDEKEEIP